MCVGFHGRRFAKLRNSERIMHAKSLIGLKETPRVTAGENDCDENEQTPLRWGGQQLPAEWCESNERTYFIKGLRMTDRHSKMHTHLFQPLTRPLEHSLDLHAFLPSVLQVIARPSEAAHMETSVTDMIVHP